jgi:hypothetical protein
MLNMFNAIYMIYHNETHQLLSEEEGEEGMGAMAI